MKSISSWWRLNWKSLYEEKVISFSLKNKIRVAPFPPASNGLLSGKINSITQFEKIGDVRNLVFNARMKILF